jgi:hypothetical protein
MRSFVAIPLCAWAAVCLAVLGVAQQPNSPKAKTPSTPPNVQNPPARAKQAFDPAAEALKTKTVTTGRPEQQLSEHDRSEQFDTAKPAPLSDALKSQPKEGRITGFDFARDPLNAEEPFTKFADVMKKESDAKPKVRSAQRKLLEERYNLKPKLDSKITMSRGKPVPVGPTARLGDDMSWEKLAK